MDGAGNNVVRPTVRVKRPVWSMGQVIGLGALTLTLCLNWPPDLNLNPIVIFPVQRVRSRHGK
jgi:hypothetical protein